MDQLVVLSEILRNLGLAIAAGVGVYLAWLRLGPETIQATTSADQAELARRAHVTELFNRAASQLDDERLEVRLAAVYVLREIGKDFPDLANPGFELLQAHLRRRVVDLETEEIPPDMQAIVQTLLLRVR